MPSRYVDRQSICRCLFVVAGCLHSVCGAFADTPTVDYIFPAGGQRGTTVEFRVGAHFLLGGSPFEMSGSGIEASRSIKEIDTIWFEGPMIFKPVSQAAESYPKDHIGTVRIDANAMPGVRFWRLWTSQGAVDSRPFIVGDLPEVVEDEIDGQSIPARVTLPVTINGRMFPREDVDIWEFEATAGQTITCEVLASRIGSPLDSRLEVRGPDGRKVAENTDHFGSDSLLRFTATQTGTWQVHIHDSTYRGLQQFVYRLTITAGTYVDRVFPLGARAGSTATFQLSGQHTPETSVEVKLPDSVAAQHLQYFPLGDSLSNPVVIELSDLDEHVEHEPNDVPARNDAITVPAILNGRVDKPSDTDHWLISAKKDQPLEFDLGSARYGSPLDAVLTISDTTGQQLSQTGSSQDNPVEPKTTVTFPADGDYVISVKDYRDDHGGPEFAYRLRIGPPRSPDFRLSLSGDAITVSRGGEAKFKVNIERLAGFKGEVALSVNGLPEDVTVTATTIPEDKKTAEIVFKAAEKAKIRVAHVSIEGAAMIGEQQLTRSADLPGEHGLPDRSDILLAVAMPAPFKLDGIDFQTSYAERGTIHRRHYLIHRDAYTGPLTLRLADRQIRHLQGVQGASLLVSPDVDAVDYPIQIPTRLEMNRTSRTVVMAVGEVEDEDGVKHKVSFSSPEVNDQIIFLTAPCPLSIRTARRSVRAEAGTSVQLGVEVARGVLDRAPVKVELLLPRHIRGIEAKAVHISSDQDEANLTLSFTRPLGPFNTPAIVRATTIVAGDPVIADTEIEFVDAELVSR